MIKLLTINIFLLLFSCFTNCLNAQLVDSIYEIQIGTKLYYTLEIDKVVYPKCFVIEVKSLAPNFSFNWRTLKPIIKSGSFKITAKALQKGTSFYHTFSGGSTLLTKETALLLSNKLYKQISKSKRKIKLSLKYGKPKVESFNLVHDANAELMAKYPAITKQVNNKSFLFTNFILENKDQTKVVRIWNNEKFPLLLYLQTDYKMYLDEITCCK